MYVETCYPTRLRTVTSNVEKGPWLFSVTPTGLFPISHIHNSLWKIPPKECNVDPPSIPHDVSKQLHRSCIVQCTGRTPCEDITGPHYKCHPVNTLGMGHAIPTTHVELTFACETTEQTTTRRKVRAKISAARWCPPPPPKNEIRVVTLSKCTAYILI